MSEDELIHSFVVRQRDLAAILETVRENNGVSNQHLLILGPRGMGKTTLVNRAVAEIRREPELNRLWYPILFDEESYTVTSPGELWFQALSHLADQTKDPELEKARRELQTVSDRTRLRDASLARILEFSDQQHKRLLLAFENVDMIFDDQMAVDDGWDVRHTLQNEPRIMVLATSTTRLDSFHDSTKPLYELFREHTLDRLDLEECRTVWHLVTGAELPPNQARPIQIFTGGNTRLLTILATFAKDRSFRELMDDLVGLIDENTSYFKHNIEALPKESRKIFVTLADLWSPATSRQVAEQTRGEIRAVSAQLGRLAEQGIIEVVRRVDKTQMFQVAERMYNLYYLLRRRGSGRVRAVVEFIVRYYDRDGMQRLLASMADEACELDPSRREDNVQAFCALIGRLPDLNQRRAAVGRAPAEFLEIPDVANLLRSLNQSEAPTSPGDEDELRKRLAATPNDAAALVKIARLLFSRGESEQALLLAKQALSADHSSMGAIGTLVIILNGDHFITAATTHVELFRWAITIAEGKTQAFAYVMFSFSLIRIGEHQHAREVANEALDCGADNSQVVGLVGVIFSALGDLQAAREAFTHALELDPSNCQAAQQLAHLLIESGRLDEAEAHLRRGLEHRPQEASLWIALCDLLHTGRHDPEAAIRELQRGRQVLPNNHEILERLGNLQIMTGHAPEAEATLRQLAIDLHFDSGFISLTSALLAQGKAEAARAMLGPKLESSDSPELHIAAAILASAMKDKPDMIRHLRGASESLSHNSPPEIQLMILALQSSIDDVSAARASADRFLADPRRMRSTLLIQICTAVLTLSLAPLYPDLIRWTRELAATSVTALTGSLLLARALALVSTWDDVWAPLTAVLAERSFASGHLPEIVALISFASARGHTPRALTILAASPAAVDFEPLLVALRRLAGQATNPPQEVSDVADDIVRDIERLRHALATAPPSAPLGLAPTTHQQHRKARKRGRASTPDR